MNKFLSHLVLTVAIMLAALPTYAMPTLMAHDAQDEHSPILQITTATEDEIIEIVAKLSDSDQTRVLVATDGPTDSLHRRLVHGLRDNAKSNRNGIIIALVPSVTSSMTLVLSGQFLAASGVAGLAWAFEILPTLAKQPFDSFLDKIGRLSRVGIFGKLGGLVAYNSAKSVIIGSLTGNFAPILSATAGQALQGLLDQFLSTQESLDLAAEQLEQRGVMNGKVAKAVPHGRNLLAGISDTLALFGFDGLSAVIKSIPQAGVIGLLLGSNQTGQFAKRWMSKRLVHTCNQLLTKNSQSNQED